MSKQLRATRLQREITLPPRESSWRLSLLLKCSELVHGRINNSKSTTLMPKVLLDKEVIATLSCLSESNSVRSSLRWVSLRCQPLDMSKAHSGTSMLFSNLKVILLEICTILSSLRSQSPALMCQKSTWRRSRRFTLPVDLDPKVTVMIGNSMRPRRIS